MWATDVAYVYDECVDKEIICFVLREKSARGKKSYN